MLKEEDKEEPDEKTNPDDIKEISVPQGEVKEGVVYYIINAETGNSSWSCMKRYSQFEEFHNTLLQGSVGRKIPSGLDLPPKRFKMWVSHTSPQFIEERRCLLENYLQRLMKVPEIAKDGAMTSFISSNKLNEKKAEKKKVDLPDDVEITGVSIPATRTMSDHILYQIDIVNSRKRKTFSKWTVLKRFGQFYEMDLAVRAAFENEPEITELLPPAPARKAKLIVDHMDESFVEQRRVLLENYLKQMLECEDVIRNKSFLTFLGVCL